MRSQLGIRAAHARSPARSIRCMRRRHDHDPTRLALARLGGIAPARDLITAGVSANDIRLAVADHVILRFRKGWYALFDLPCDVVRASRVGGVLTCVSAAAHHGLWVPDDTRLHVAVPTNASRLRSAGDHHTRLDLDAPDVVVHWTADRGAPYELVVSVPRAIECIARCCSADDAFAVLESALRKRRMSRRDVQELAARVPRGVRNVLMMAGDLSDSGTESALALTLTRVGIPFRQQVHIAGVGFVDFVIGERLIVEVDSRPHHSDPTNDRRRDAVASLAGFRTLRFMYSQIVFDRPTVLRAIRSAIERGDHRAA